MSESESLPAMSARIASSIMILAISSGGIASLRQATRASAISCVRTHPRKDQGGRHGQPHPCQFGRKSRTGTRPFRLGYDRPATHRHLCVLHRRSSMDSCRRRKGETRESFPGSDRAWLSDAGDGGPASDAGRRHPDRCRRRPELRDRQGSLPCTGACGRPRAAARRSCGCRAQGRRTGDHEDAEHAGSRGIGKACFDCRNASASDSRDGSKNMTGMENRIEVPSSDGISEQASRNTLALNPLVGITGQDLADSAGVLFKAMVNEPKVAAEQWLSFLGELGAIAGGKSERVPKAGDRRFSDPTWKESGLHSGLLKAYLAWGEAVSGLVDKTSLNDVDKARAHLITEILIDAVAPTNAMLTNPAAVRKFVDTGGQSLWLGLKNYFDDLIKNRGMPSMVDASAFKVAENLATTPGAVVFRNELLELIQYAPTAAKGSKPTLVLTAAPINQ